MTDTKTDKIKIRATLDLEFEGNEEHVYELITRAEHSIHRQIQLGMFGADHPMDAALTDFAVKLEETE